MDTETQRAPCSPRRRLGLDPLAGAHVAGVAGAAHPPDDIEPGHRLTTRYADDDPHGVTDSHGSDGALRLSVTVSMFTVISSYAAALVSG